MDRGSVLIFKKKIQRDPHSLSSFEDTAVCELQRRPLPDTESASASILDFQPLELYKIDFCCLYAIQFTVFFVVAEWTRTSLDEGWDNYIRHNCDI
jgi:hypothetical protein